jgi:hypothetical protein
VNIMLTFVNQSTDTNNSQIVIFEGPPAPAESSGGEAPLLVHRVFALPPAGRSVSVSHSGSTLAIGVSSAATAGEPLTSPLSQPPARLALPAAPSATILVKGGGTVPVFFVLGSDGADAPADPPAAQPSGFLASIISAVRRIWRVITGGR